MSKVKAVDWREAKPAPLVLVSGKVDYTADRAIRAIRDALKSQDANLEVHELSAADYSAGQLLALSSPSLFAEPRLIVIRDCERCSDDFIEDAIAYAANPTDDTTLIVRHNSSSVRAKKLLDALRTNGSAIEIACLEIKTQELAGFVQAEFAALNRKATPGAVRALTDAFPSDLAELAAAVQQLTFDASETIDEEIVNRYYGGRVEVRAFKVVDEALAGKPGQALLLLRHSLASGSDPVPIVIGIAMKLRQMAKIWGDRSVSAAAVGMAPWALEATRRQLSGWSEAGLARVLEQIAATDAAVKGAERDPIFALERLVLLIAAKGETV